MTFRNWTAAIAVIAGLAAAGAAEAQAPTQVGAIAGVWRNPKNSVHVDIKACGAAICGYVVWATPKAEADARKAGNPKLVGMQLLRDFTPRGSGWRGKVFVPDLNATFTGTAELVDADTLKARGCLIPGIACKTQLWRRLGAAAD
jgi:uncharacterized protein (DUF2147 family)